MRKFQITEILSATKGQLLSGTAGEFTGIGTDTRKDLSGQLFIALKGESFDAHDFVEKAVQAGARGVLVDHDIPALASTDVTVICVPDTLKALQAIGRWERRQHRATVIGLTGSNGKTTTKEFTAAIIAPFREVHWSKGSFNNHWGVPFTLLDLEATDEVAVIEMGMNHAGEITELVGIAEPDVVLCTMVGRAHIEHFGTIEKIAAAKEEIYEAAKAEATRIYNLDDPSVRAMHDKAAARFPKARVLTFSATNAAANVHLRLKSLTMRSLELEGHLLGEEASVKVEVFGAQNLTNLMAAATAALAVGLEPEQVWQGLAHCKTAWGRNQFVRLGSGAEMIFDAYNANPDSMKALLDNMKLLKNDGRKVGVFGQMLEMGPQSPVFHEEIGEKAGTSGFQSVYFIGADEEAFRRGLTKAGYRGELHAGRDYSEEMGRSLAGGLKAGDVVVVKGSRGTKLERFVAPCEPIDFGKKD